jgi:hypothetical protein
MKQRTWLVLFFSFGLLGSGLPAAPAWQPAKGPLLTRWAKDVSPRNPLPEYPRPQLVRKEWQSLNGLWDYAIAPTNAPQPSDFQGRILVPFPVESALSGVMKTVGESNRLWYRRTFTVPRSWRNKRVLLNFGAVDWEARVSVNGKEIGIHQGGYDAFSFDITDALKPRGDQEILVSVWDPSDAGPQPRGKQVRKAGGIWYTPTTGIWQTPWLEPVDVAHIDSLKITPDFDVSAVEVTALVTSRAMIGKRSLRVEVLEGGNVSNVGTINSKSAFVPLRGQSAAKRALASAEIQVKDALGLGGNTNHIPLKVRLTVPEAKPWSPDSPHLYGLRVTLVDNDKEVDQAESYFGMRKISMARDDKNVLRLFLNNQPLFQYGPLDQGFWPDGLYTAPTDEALKWDIEMTKKLGFNMARKHVKVEPARWYYWCDKLGLLVWQDMPSGDKSARWTGPSGYDGEEMKRTPDSAAIYEKEWRALIASLYNHPSIVVWVPFNEGWGQFDTVRILNLTKQLDPTRLVDGPSGGNHFPAGDIIDHHQYPGPAAPKPVTDRVMVLGEFGGLGLPVKGHTWQDEKNWGYRSFKTSNELTDAYVGLLRKLHPMIGSHGLAAAIYTQTTDVEVEINGLFTYDRAVLKMDEKRITAAARQLFTPPPPAPKRTELAPTAQKEAVTWRYTTEMPHPDWFKAEFDASGWQEGPAGFGARGTPGAVVRTEWKTSDIWLRREFTVTDLKNGEVRLAMHHDEDVEVYLNGVLASKAPRWTSDYEEFEVSPEAVKSLKRGRNILAVHCRQKTGGQYIDAGVWQFEPAGQ